MLRQQNESLHNHVAPTEHFNESKKEEQRELNIILDLKKKQ